VAWRGSFGVRSATTGARVTDDTIFEAASLTKPFFAYYVMKLAGQKVLSLDSAARRVLRPRRSPRSWPPLDEPGFRRDWFEKVTGPPRPQPFAGFPHGEFRQTVPSRLRARREMEVLGDGYFYLQRVVEHLKGGTLDALMQKEVLERWA